MAAAGDQHAVPPAQASKLRFPLRSATKPVDKEEEASAADTSIGWLCHQVWYSPTIFRFVFPPPSLVKRLMSVVCEECTVPVD